jgi:hypothetical protein
VLDVQQITTQASGMTRVSAREILPQQVSDSALLVPISF